MNRRMAFLSAFLAGLAAPTMLFARPASYVEYVGDFTVHGSFAQVGAIFARVSHSV